MEEVGSYVFGIEGCSVAGVVKALARVSIEGLSLVRDKMCDFERGPWWMTSAPKTVPVGGTMMIIRPLYYVLLPDEKFESSCSRFTLGD